MKKMFAFLLVALLLSTGTSLAAPEYTLSLNLPIPPIHSRWNNAIKPWMDELTKRSGGRIVVEPYFAEALSKQSESMDSVRNSLADLSESNFGMAIGQFPFHERVFDCADFRYSIDKPNVIMHEMQRSFPQVMNEVKGVKLLFTHALPVGMLVGTKKPIKSLDDLKGLKIAVIGGATTTSRLKALGASVVSIPVIDIYMALEQGIIDGTMCDFQLLVSRRFGDIIKHVTLLPLNGGQFYCVMNQDIYDGMPADLQKIITDMSGEYAETQFEKFWHEDQFSSMQIWREKMGGQLHLLSDADYDKANALVKPAEEEWISILNKSGLPGKDMLTRLRALEAQYNKPWKESEIAKYVTK